MLKSQTNHSIRKTLIKENIINDIENIKLLLKNTNGIYIDGKLDKEAIIYSKTLKWENKYLFLKPTTKNLQLLGIFDKNYPQTTYINETLVKDKIPLVNLILNNIEEPSEVIFEKIKDRMILIDIMSPGYQKYLNVIKVEKALINKKTLLSKYPVYLNKRYFHKLLLDYLCKVMAVKCKDKNIMNLQIKYYDTSSSVKLMFMYELEDEEKILNFLKNAEKRDKKETSKNLEDFKLNITRSIKENLLSNSNQQIKLDNYYWLVINPESERFLYNIIEQIPECIKWIKSNYSFNIDYCNLVKDFQIKIYGEVYLTLDEFYDVLDKLILNN